MEDISRIWPEWKTEELIGRGSFGSVYKIKKEKHGIVSYAAVKIIEIPSDQSEMMELRAAGMSEATIRSYFHEKADSLMDEISIMESVKSEPNIVSIEDFDLKEQENGPGYTIFIRMELLTSLNRAYPNYTLPKEQTVKIGLDITNALSVCESKNIIHRDIKPENIFVTENRTYKLGDFGIARKLENRSSAFSQKGTPVYMAPEIVRGEKYDSRADIYSLGVMLYRFVNHGKLPFFPSDPNMVHPEDTEEVVTRRLSGEAIPAPDNGDPELNNIILKACSFDPKDRYQSARAMHRDLVLIDRHEPKGEQTVILTPPPEPDPVPTPSPEPKPMPSPEPIPSKRTLSPVLIALLSAVIVFATAVAVVFIYTRLHSGTANTVFPDIDMKAEDRNLPDSREALEIAKENADLIYTAENGKTEYFKAYKGEDVGVESWYAAEKYCENLGGHLAVIDSQELNEKLFRAYKGSDDTKRAFFAYYYPGSGEEINGSDKGWEWAVQNASDISFTNWGSDKDSGSVRPYYHTHRERYAAFDENDSNWNNLGFGNGGFTNFICEWGDGRDGIYIKETETVPTENVTTDSNTGHRYYIFQSDSVKSWDEARNECEKLGGHLAIITSGHENSLLYNMLSGSGYDGAFIGYKLEGESDGMNDTWNWVDEADETYVNAIVKENKEMGTYETWFNRTDTGDAQGFVEMVRDTPANEPENLHWQAADFEPGSAFICEWDY